jgi:hypothetical protein
MEYFAHGFLSEPLDEVREVVRQRYAGWRSVLISLNEACVTAQHEIPVNVDEAQHLLSATYFARTLASTQATVILLECGLLPQAKAVLRSALESLFALAAIEKKPELALPLAQSQEANKKALADKMLQWQSEELRVSLFRLIDEPKLREFVSTDASSFNTYQLAEAAGMKDWYLSMYVLLSFPAHALVSDLVSHIVTDDLGNVTALKNEPEIEGQEMAWAFAIEIQLRAARAVREIFNLKHLDLDDYANALRGLGTTTS